MTQPMFFNRGAGLSIGEIAAIAGAVPRPGTNLELRITDIAPLDRAGPADLAFFEKAKYAADLISTRAGACLTTERLEGQVPPHIAVLRTREPYRAFVAVARSLFADSLRPSSLFDADGISPGATIHPSARLESGVTVDPGVIIGPRAEIGAGTVVAAAAVIGPDVRIGRDCSIGSGVTIQCALIGDRVILHPGVRIGQDGYGFLPGPRHQKIPQVARVIIQDDVEIGANSTVDRGALRDTVIGEGTKIDNLVQVAHNVVIGRHCFLVSQVGISGSVTIGDYAVLGGQVGVIDHATIGEGAMLGGQAGVMTDVPAGARWGGHPAGPVREWMRGAMALRRLGRRQGDSSPSAEKATDGDET